MRKSRRFQVIEESVAVSQSLPNVRVCQKTAVLGVLGEFDCFVSEVLCEMRVAARFGALSNAFLDEGVFDHASQQSASGHEDMIVPRLTQMKSRFRFFLRVIQVAV